MKKILLFGSCILFFSCLIKGQPAKCVFAELGGPGLASLNYDMRFSNREDGIGGRVGIGGFSIDDVTAIFVPVAVNYLIGKDNKNYFEIGAGATFASLSDNGGGDYGEDDVFDGTFGHISLGYRLQPANGGFTFRAAIVPIFGHGVFLPYYAGISFGYKF